MRAFTFVEDLTGLHGLASIVEEGDSGFVVVGDNEQEVFNRAHELYTDHDAVDFEVVHDTVDWQWVGVVVT